MSVIQLNHNLLIYKPILSILYHQKSISKAIYSTLLYWLCLQSTHRHL